MVSEDAVPFRRGTSGSNPSRSTGESASEVNPGVISELSEPGKEPCPAALTIGGRGPWYGWPSPSAIPSRGKPAVQKKEASLPPVRHFSGAKFL